MVSPAFMCNDFEKCKYHLNGHANTMQMRTMLQVRENRAKVLHSRFEIEAGHGLHI